MKEQLANMTIIELVKKSHEATSNQLTDEMPVLVTELASRLEALNLAYIGAMNNLRSATSTIERMGVEGAYLLNGAAAELNGSWVRHKTVLGAQAALLCISQGDICAAREWLEGTIDEVGADMPDDMTVAGLQAWFNSQMVAIDGKSGFLTRREAEDAIRARIPTTDTWQREQRAQAHKEGAYFVANRMLAAWEAGFIEDTAKNAADIARMILTSTEFMAEAPEGDFDRSFADGVLEDIAAQLRAGEALNLAHIGAMKELRSATSATAIPEGYALVPQEMCLSAEAMEAICFHCGDGGFAFGEFTDGVLFVGDSEPEEGKKVHGLHIVTADYPEEGCAVICEFLPAPRNGETV